MSVWAGREKIHRMIINLSLDEFLQRINGQHLPERFDRLTSAHLAYRARMIVAISKAIDRLELEQVNQEVINQHRRQLVDLIAHYLGW